MLRGRHGSARWVTATRKAGECVLSGYTVVYRAIGNHCVTDRGGGMMAAPQVLERQCKSMRRRRAQVTC
jgi:hypothetical protein